MAMPEDRRLMWICVALAITSLAMLYIALHWRPL